MRMASTKPISDPKVLMPPAAKTVARRAIMSQVVPDGHGREPVRSHSVIGDAARSMTSMAFYEYLCRDCDTSFELRRAMVDADDPVTCPNGHTDVRRKLSVFASIGA